MIAALTDSAKDKAELLMVTDMIRNDIGRICKTGSIAVPVIFAAHTFSHYHHLISTVTGELKPDTNFYDVFKAIFPCGSITGAPKIKVIESIDKLENQARGVYTGALGLISNNGYVDFSVPIRTLTIHNNQISFGVGGGIVADSQCDSEYDECLLKAKGLLESLQCKNTKI